MYSFISGVSSDVSHLDAHGLSLVNLAEQHRLAEHKHYDIVIDNIGLVFIYVDLFSEEVSMEVLPAPFQRFFVCLFFYFLCGKNMLKYYS